MPAAFSKGGSKGFNGDMGAWDSWDMGMMSMMGAMMMGKGKGKGDKGGKGGESSGGVINTQERLDALTASWDPYASLKRAGVSYSANTGKKAEDAMPEITMVHVGVDSPHVQQGYPQDMVALEFDKRVSLFSESHYILQDLLYESGMDTSNCTFDHDPDALTYPHVYKAWKAAGKEDNMPTVALLPDLKIWGVGFGGKKNAERAAKLALTITLAGLCDPVKLQKCAQDHPAFGQMMTNMILQASQATDEV